MLGVGKQIIQKHIIIRGIKMVRGSLRSKVLKYLKENPSIELIELKEVFRDENEETVRNYYQINKQKKKPVDIKAELLKIIRDYKQPASSRVQAIREYNNMVKNQTETKEDTNIDPYTEYLRQKGKPIPTDINSKQNDPNYDPTFELLIELEKEEEESLKLYNLEENDEYESRRKRK